MKALISIIGSQLQCFQDINKGYHVWDEIIIQSRPPNWNQVNQANTNH
jgi:hypothetical protein